MQWAYFSVEAERPLGLEWGQAPFHIGIPRAAGFPAVIVLERSGSLYLRGGGAMERGRGDSFLFPAGPNGPQVRPSGTPF